MALLVNWGLAYWKWSESCISLVCRILMSLIIILRTLVFKCTSDFSLGNLALAQTKLSNTCSRSRKRQTTEFGASSFLLFLPSPPDFRTWIISTKLTLTLIPLLSEAPEKVVAKGTEGWLPEELGHKPVTFHLMDFLMLDRSPPSGNVWTRFWTCLLFLNAACKGKEGKWVKVSKYFRHLNTHTPFEKVEHFHSYFHFQREVEEEANESSSECRFAVAVKALLDMKWEWQPLVCWNLLRYIKANWSFETSHLLPTFPIIKHE